MINSIINVNQKKDYLEIKKELNKKYFFEKKTWKSNFKPFLLSNEQLDDIKKIGQACYEFYKALDVLYMRSKKNKSLLRNRNFYFPYISEYYDRGKPDFFKNHNISNVNKFNIPTIIRPDLLITEKGFSMTEIDSVPGGIGLTAFLNQIYKKKGFSVIESKIEMINGFYNSIVPKNLRSSNPFIIILISDESKTYKPEFLWIAEELRKKGKKIYCSHPKDIKSESSFLIWKNNQKINIVYRFFELFDWKNISCLDSIIESIELGNVLITPPMKTYQEEKMSFAFFNHYLLEDFWKENLSQCSFQILKNIIPKTWIIDPIKINPYLSILNAPQVKGKSIYSWEQLKNASKKDRNWIIKISGFHELAWGARSVVYGSDVSQETWEEEIKKITSKNHTSLYILQEYKKPILIEQEIYEELNDNFTKKNGRVRLCPYFYIENNQIELSGILSTFCEADKKIIHGMSDAFLMPCMV